MGYFLFASSNSINNKRSMVKKMNYLSELVEGVIFFFENFGALLFWALVAGLYTTILIGLVLETLQAVLS